jgi:hypothetical protein
MQPRTQNPLASFGRSFDTQQQGYSVAHNGENSRGVMHPLNPVRVMEQKRSKILKVRLTDAEFDELAAPLIENGRPVRGLSKVVRARLFSSKRVAIHVADCKHCRLLAMVADNLNVISRRCQAVPNQEQLIELIVCLKNLECEILKATAAK